MLAAVAPLDHVSNLHRTAVMEAIVPGDGGPDHQAVLDALLSVGAGRALGGLLGGMVYNVNSAATVFRKSTLRLCETEILRLLGGAAIRRPLAP